jgi:hypothetical protein
MLGPIRFHCVGDQVSTGLPFIYLHTRSWPCVAYTEFRITLDVPKRNYCISRGVSLVVLGVVKRKYFQDVKKKMGIMHDFRLPARCEVFALLWCYATLIGR